jgi:peptidoglycan/xylan/chitin deacetylase (PgdA/CDA1 family)
MASRSGAHARLSILIFHRVLPHADPVLSSEPTAAQFDALLGHLKSRFCVLPLKDAAMRLRAGSLPARSLCITFDDGYADNLTVAAPLLRKHGLPATLFVATGYLDGDCMFNDLVIAACRSEKVAAIDLSHLGLDVHPLRTMEERRTAIDRILERLKYVPPGLRHERAQDIVEAAGVPLPRGLMLTPDDVRALPEWGFDVGAHTIRHPILTQTSNDEAWGEIDGSKRELEGILRREVDLFAYPNGHPGEDYSVEHVRMVREAGFAVAVSTAWGAARRTSDPLQLPRFTPWARHPLKFDLLMLRNLRTGAERQAA